MTEREVNRVSPNIAASMIKQITLHPSRIGCPSIPGTMKGMISSIDGVSGVAVRYTDRSLDIIFDDRKTTPQEIVKKIGAETGIALEVAEEHGSAKTDNPADTCPM